MNADTHTHYLPFFVQRNAEGQQQAVCGEWLTTEEQLAVRVAPTCPGCAFWFDNLDVIDPPASAEEQQVA